MTTSQGASAAAAAGSEVLTFADVRYPYAERWHRIGGVRVCTVDEGPREGDAAGAAAALPPVVLLPAAGRSLTHYDPVYEALAARRRVIGVDPPGWGKSDKRDDLPCSVDWYADWLPRLLDALGIERAALVGSSMGGLMATLCAARRPDRVAGIALIGTAGGPRRPLRAMVMRLMLSEQRMLAPTPTAFARRMRAYFHGEVPALDEIVRRGIAISRSAEWPSYVRILVRGASSVIGRDAAPELGRVRAPALVLWGEQDRIFPTADAHAIAATLRAGQARSVRVSVIPECGHFPPLERPREVERELIAWLEAEVDPDARGRIEDRRSGGGR